MNIISEWKQRPKGGAHGGRNQRIKHGYKRVMAIVEEEGQRVTRHIDIKR